MHRSAVIASLLLALSGLAAANQQWAKLVISGNEFRSQGRYRDARAMYKKALTLAAPRTPELAATLNNLGTVEDDLGNEPEAERHYLRSISTWEALNIQEGAAGPTGNLALLNRKLGRYDRARELYQRVLGIRGSTPQLHVNLGRLAVLQGELEEAGRHYQRAASLLPENASAIDRATLLTNLAELEHTRGDLAQAEKTATEALRFAAGTPVEIDARLMLGAIASGRAQHEVAVEHLSRAVAISEQVFGTAHAVTACAYAELSGVLQSLKRKREAREYRERAVSAIAAFPSRHRVSVAELLERR